MPSAFAPALRAITQPSLYLRVANSYLYNNMILIGIGLLTFSMS